MDSLRTVLEYHERTKHHPSRYARALGYLDWATQPDPFRRYIGADLLALELVEPANHDPPFDQIYQPLAVSQSRRTPLAASRTPHLSTISRLFHDSLALSAWKEYGPSRWSLRVNPSSGNLHPTEGYLIAGPIDDLANEPALYHYAPHEHALELRRAIADTLHERLVADLPRDTLFVGLTSVHWRESWKYGERAYRYCQHDAGHAVASIAFAAALLDWRTTLLSSVADDEIARLLGVGDQSGPEAEHPDCLLALCPADSTDADSLFSWRPDPEALRDISRLPLIGTPNTLSAEHHDWPIIDDVARAANHVESTFISERAGPSSAPTGRLQTPGPRTARLAGSPHSAHRIIHQRRSAVSLDGRTTINRETFFRMLEMTIPRPDRLPFAAFPWRPCVHLLLFVHRVEGVAPGLCLLSRDREQTPALREAITRRELHWQREPDCPDDLDLIRLADGDTRDAAKLSSCHQDIAADGCFAVAMLGEFEPALRRHGPWFYRAMHWEAGAIGQVLYLEAEAAGGAAHSPLRGTGIGCFFDDATHSILGLHGRRYQTIYHFTLGGPVEDRRLRTTPAYAHRR